MPEAERLAKLRAEGLDGNHIPLNATEAERTAAMDAPAVVPPKPLFPSWLAHLASLLAPLLALAASIAPAPFNALAFALAFVFAFLGGLPLPSPSFTSEQAHIPAALVPVALSLATVIGTTGAHLADGPLKAAVVLAGLVLAWLGGKLVPQPAQ